MEAFKKNEKLILKKSKSQSNILVIQRKENERWRKKQIENKIL